MELKKKGDIQYVTAGGDGFDAVFLTRLSGVSLPPYDSLNMSYTVGDEKGKVDENYARVFSAFGLDLDKLIRINQVHGDDVLIIREGENAVSGGDYDAVITDDMSLVLSVLTADCVPILLADPKRSVFAAVHAGWRGTAKSIVKKAVAAMEREFSCGAHDISAYIGPAIGVCCYDVSQEVADRADSTLINKKSSLKRESGQRVFVDLKGYNAAQLIECGISGERIESSDLCTACRGSLFFSYRNENATGRQMSLIFIGGAV
jgi:YfiH family protein